MFASRVFAPHVFAGRVFSHATVSALSWTTDPGGLFRRIGRETYLLDSINHFRGTSDLSAASIVSVGLGVDHIAAQYDTTDQSLVDGLYASRDGFRNALSGFPVVLQRTVTATLVTMIDEAFVVPSRKVAACLSVLVAQMAAAGQTVNANAVGLAVGTGTNTGTALCTASLKGPSGRDQENVFAETITLTCTSDAQSSSATAGSESWSVAGETAVSGNNALAWDWPAGSGASTSLRATDATATNLLSNGAMDTFTVANTPDGWTIAVGTLGVTVFRESTVVYKGGYALKITGDGSQLTTLTQALTSLLPSTVYAFACRHKVSSVPAAGVLSLELWDGAAIVNDDAGTPNAVTQALTASTTGWTALSGFFRTPSVMPAAVTFRIRLSTALTAAASLYLDELALVVPKLTYPGGPYTAVFAGSTNSVRGDSFTVVVTNDRAGKLQTSFERFFGMRLLGLQLPSDAVGAESIADSLVY